MHPRMNLPCPPSTDAMHSMMMQAQAEALLETAHNLVREAFKLLSDDFTWHRPDCAWKVPPDIAAEGDAAFAAVKALRASTHWTVNSLRKKPEAQLPEPT